MHPLVPLLVLLVLAAGVMGARKASGSTATLMPASPEERKAVLFALQRLNWPAAEVNKAITRESGWKPGAMNPTSHAVGLIQFMPFILAKLGFRPDLPAFARAEAFSKLMTPRQLPYIVDYFKSLPRDWKVPGDTYVALAGPDGLGKPDSHVLYPVGSKAWQQNPGLRISPSGPITVGKLRQLGRVS